MTNSVGFKSLIKVLSLLFLATFLFVTNAVADGSSRCEKKAISSSSFIGASKQAEKLLDELNKSNVNVAIVSRVGSDLSKRGLKYTHAGIIWRSSTVDHWRVTHLLNNCGSSKSAIYAQGLLDFFLDDPFSYDSLVTIPAKEIRGHLLDVLTDKSYNKIFSNEYSMIAYPFSKEFMNSNQFVLETIALAQSRMNGLVLHNRTQAQALLQTNGYEGTLIRLRALEILFGGIFKENVAFSDHTDKEIETGWFVFVSAKSIGEYLQKVLLLEKTYELLG